MIEGAILMVAGAAAVLLLTTANYVWVQTKIAESNAALNTQATLSAVEIQRRQAGLAHRPVG